MPKKKLSHAEDSIYVVRQFAYVHGVAGISLLSGKNTKCSSTVFQSLKKRQQQTLITKIAFFTSCVQDPQWAKKPCNIIQIRSSCQLDQT